VGLVLSITSGPPVKKQAVLQTGRTLLRPLSRPEVACGQYGGIFPDHRKLGNLVGICPECDSFMNKHVSLAKIAQIIGIIDISFREEVRRRLYSPSKSISPCVSGHPPDGEATRRARTKCSMRCSPSCHGIAPRRRRSLRLSNIKAGTE
jgi:hypothetical protein